MCCDHRNAENIHTETYAVAEKALQDNAELPTTQRATKIILAACKYLSDTKAMTFIENDAKYPQVLETLVHGACKELFD